MNDHLDYRGYRFPRELSAMRSDYTIDSHSVYATSKNLLAERGVIVSYESIRLGLGLLLLKKTSWSHEREWRFMSTRGGVPQFDSYGDSENRAVGGLKPRRIILVSEPLSRRFTKLATTSLK